MIDPMIGKHRNVSRQPTLSSFYTRRVTSNGKLSAGKLGGKLARGLALLVLLLVAVPGTASAELSCERVPDLLKAYLRKHISFHYLNDELRQRTTDSYLKRLDPSKSLFLTQERTALEQSLKGIFHDVRGGDCSALLDIRDDMAKRYLGVQHFVANFVGNDDYELDSSIKLIIDPEKRARPSTPEERDDLYRRLVHFQMSNYLTNGEDFDESKRKLIHRYELMTKRANEMTAEDSYAAFLDAFANALDPHSNYFTADAMEDFQISMELSLDGIGVALSSRDGYSVVEKIIPGGAAARLDILEPGDKIIAVAQDEGEFVDIIDMNLRDVVRLIRGERGTRVRLSILRQQDTTERLVVSVIRAEIKLEDQAAALRFETIETEEGKTLKLAVVELPSFYGGGDPTERQSAKDMRDLLQQVKEEKADGLLLDLSRNGGGLLDDSVKIAGFFIRSGGVVAVKDTFSKVQVLPDPDDSLLYNGPLVLLTSRISASASEIVAGAMKDYGRAIVVGDDHTFGKGTVQSMMPLPRDLGALKVTTQMFFRPGGASTQREGVAADIVFPSIYAANKLGEAHQDYSLPSQQIDSFIETSALSAPNTSDENFWAPITPALLAELASLSAKRIDESEEFADIRRQITETEERNGILHLTDIYDPAKKEAEEAAEKEREKAGKEGPDSADASDSAEPSEASEATSESKGPGPTTAQAGNPQEGQVASTAGNAAEPSDLASIPPSTDTTESEDESAPPTPQQREALQILADFVRLQG
jgi:carboxyl-terminal processing protease